MRLNDAADSWVLDYFGSFMYMYVTRCLIFSHFRAMTRRVLQFLQSTSIKGIPRIFKTKSRFLKALWITCVISFLGMTAYQVYLLVHGYLEYESVMSTTEYNVDLTGATHKKVRLPDMTFCNMNPFAVDTRKITGVPSLEVYSQRVREMTECEDCSPEQQDTMWELRVALQTTTGYYMHIGLENARRLSHTEDQFIAACTVEMLSGMDPRKLPCKYVTTVFPHFDYMYYECYTIRIPRATSTDLYTGIVVVLHLNNHLDTIEQQKYLTAHYMPGQMSGAVMAFHHQDEIPVLAEKGISLPSGFYMSTKLRFVRRQRLPHPYGMRNEDSDIQDITCYADCLQEHVMSHCNCIDYASPDIALAIYTDLLGLEPCLSLNQSREELFEKWICMEETRLNSTTYCQSMCPVLCDELIYDYAVSCMGAWPLWQGHFSLDQQIYTDKDNGWTRVFRIIKRHPW